MYRVRAHECMAGFEVIQCDVFGLNGVRIYQCRKAREQAVAFVLRTTVESSLIRQIFTNIRMWFRLVPICALIIIKACSNLYMTIYFRYSKTTICRYNNPITFTNISRLPAGI